jgi:dynein heavy chain
MIEQTLRHLQELSIGKEKEIDKTKELKKAQMTLHNIGMTVQKEIDPFMKIQSEKTKNQIAGFEEDMKVFHKSLRNKPYTEYTCGVEKAQENITGTKETASEHKKELEKYTYFSEMFGFPDLVEGSQKTLETVDAELLVISTLWDHIDETVK